ncbi:MAG TPA: hypothetical protein VN030_02985 [Cellvibrio sp.]|nr:hypothetical protein [Cellvibrio sp.]
MMFFLQTRFNLIALSLLLSCCSSTKPINLQDWDAGLTTEWVSVQQHQLLTLGKPADVDPPQAIHFYIEGDGTPWVKRFLIAKNPTPRYPLALALMKRDPGISFYLGRPCYYQSADFYLALSQGDSGSPCDFHYWTDGRYSAEVVELMKAAMVKTLQQLPADKKNLPVVLIGHSGGGTLAMLLAQRLEEVSGVITIAANMDTEAWTKRQGYSPLKKSLNLISETHLRNIPQVHFAGSIDDVVPPDINQPLMQKLQRELTIIEGFDHSCCWLDDWPALLQRAERQLQQQALK